MKDLFILKNDLWNRLTSSDPALLSEATLQKLIALTDYLENEVHDEYNLTDELTANIRMLFAKSVWHYSTEEDFELSIEVMFDLLLASIRMECGRCSYSSGDVESMSKGLKELICSIPETLMIHETKIRAIVIRSYLIDKYMAKGCPEELVYQLVPSQKDIERRLLMDALDSSNN